MSGLEEEKQAIRKRLLAARQETPRPADFSLFALELLESTPGLVASYWSTETEPDTQLARCTPERQHRAGPAAELPGEPQRSIAH